MKPVLLAPFLLASALLAVSAPAAYCATTTLATAAIFGGAKAASYTCYFSNYSGHPVTLADAAVISDDGSTSLPLTGNNCTTLSTTYGISCQVEAAVPQPPSQAFSCSIQAAVTPAIAAAMRVTILVQDASGNVITNQPGR
jgi:hypothetical protein